jgi:hypothetical protein
LVGCLVFGGVPEVIPALEGGHDRPALLTVFQVLGDPIDFDCGSPTAHETLEARLPRA